MNLHIESLDHEGRGVARHDGKVIFVSGALPGEVVEVEITRLISYTVMKNFQFENTLKSVRFENRMK